jgi:hypothetical protein
MGLDYVSELRPSTGLLLIPQMIYERGATVNWYWQGKTEELGDKPAPVPLCPNPTWTDPAANSGLIGKRPATNRLRKYFKIMAYGKIPNKNKSFEF